MDWIDGRTARSKTDDSVALQAVRSVVQDLATYGYRRVWGVLRMNGMPDGRPISHKRVYRVMRDHHLLLYRHGQRPVSQRRHDGKVAVDKSNTRWCSDGFELSCDNGERVRIAFALDCCDREVMSWVATTKGIDANLVSDLMMQAVEYRFGDAGPPSEIEWLSDNGSAMKGATMLATLEHLGVAASFSRPRVSNDNAYAESLFRTCKYRPDYPKKLFGCLQEAQAWTHKFVR